MNGKQKCKILKDIRRQIAQENDIDLMIAECTHRGDCRGTCPRCEAEVRYLEQQLEKRRRLQKRIALAGISAGVTLALSGCAAVEMAVDALVPRERDGGGQVETLEGEVGPEEIFVTDGEVAPGDYIEYSETTTGLLPPEDFASQAPAAN